MSSGSLMVYTLGGEHFHHAASGPGTPAPRAATVSRGAGRARWRTSGPPRAGAGPLRLTGSRGPSESSVKIPVRLLF